MNKSLLITTVFSLLIFSCAKDIDKYDLAQSLRGHTFNVIEKSKQDTLVIEFMDSTYHLFHYHRGDSPWRIANYDRSLFLVLDLNVSAITRINEDNFRCVSIGHSNVDYKLEKRIPKWKREMIYGEWVQERYMDTDSTSFPPPPFGYPPDDWPPSYTITENSITNNLYTKSKSNIKINDTSEFIDMDLNHSMIGIEKEWFIKSLNDSIMVIDRFIVGGNDFSYSPDFSINVKMLKKR